MTLPGPIPGLVLRYSYAGRNEALQGVEEGRKDRPCVVILAVVEDADRTVVTVAPITHTPPSRPDLCVEIPPATKRRLGLDEQPSWIVAGDLNRFVWPGFDLRPIAKNATTFAYGLLPAPLYDALRDKVLALGRKGGVAITPQDDVR